MADRKPCANPACKRWAHDGYRYCVDCGTAVRARLEEANYLTPDRWFRGRRNSESRENIQDTKHG